MAKYVIPPRTTIVECRRCKTLYAPELIEENEWHSSERKLEECPICGYERNDYCDAIPLWRYNLIKWFRGGFRGQPVTRRTDD